MWRTRFEFNINPYMDVCRHGSLTEKIIEFCNTGPDRSKRKSHRGRNPLLGLKIYQSLYWLIDLLIYWLTFMSCVNMLGDIRLISIWSLQNSTVSCLYILTVSNNTTIPISRESFISLIKPFQSIFDYSFLFHITEPIELYLVDISRCECHDSEYKVIWK